jgi:TetR/AcrR family transcriptional regulator
MVSQRAGRRAVTRPTKAPDSRARLVAAAAQEFAARGFDGAKVDRIAARARVNKAMLYYHFKNKAALYREILRDVFGTAGDLVEAARAAGGSPEHQLRAFIVAIADGAATRPHFPAIWLREMAEGGRHLDDSVILQIRRVMQVLGGILTEGQQAGSFRPVNPFIAQMGIVAPLLLFSATAPVRERFREHAPFPVTDIPREAIIEHVQTMTLAAIAAERSPVSRRATSSRRQGS